MELEAIMEHLTTIIVGAVAVALVLVIVYLRTKENKITTDESDHPFKDVDTNIEYMWEERPNLWLRMLLLLFIIGAAAWAWLSLPFVRGLASDMTQLWFVGIWLISVMFGGMSKAYRYALTEKGLIRKDLSKSKKDAKPELLFHWNQVKWVKTSDHGFRYYLKGDVPKSKGALEETFNLKNSSGGFVKVGDNAMLVNSLIMSRGISTTPPSESGNQ